jgi:hypothetical protein
MKTKTPDELHTIICLLVMAFLVFFFIFMFIVDTEGKPKDKSDAGTMKESILRPLADPTINDHPVN